MFSRRPPKSEVDVNVSNLQFGSTEMILDRNLEPLFSVSSVRATITIYLCPLGSMYYAVGILCGIDTKEAL
jgi:hypothetical protein